MLYYKDIYYVIISTYSILVYGIWYISIYILQFYSISVGYIILM